MNKAVIRRLRLSRDGHRGLFGPTGSTLSRVSAMLAAMAAGLSGCQSYQPRPINVNEVRATWLERSPEDASVRAFAATLASREASIPGAFDPSDGLTLAEAEAVALVFNRELRVARLEANVTRATAETAGLWEDPVAGVDLERIVSGVSSPWVIAGTIGLTIPISGRLEAEKQLAGADYAAQLQRVAAKEWATRAALRELWVEWSAQSNREQIAIELVEQLRFVADLANRQEHAGVMSRIDARLFRVELAGAEADLIAATARTREMQLQLRDLLGLSPAAPVRFVQSVVFEGRGAEGNWSLATLEQGNAELAAVRSEYEVAEHTLRTEVRGQYPDLSIGPGYGSDQGDERVLLGVRLPIPLWNRNRQGVAEAMANRDVARGKFASTFEHLAARLAIAQTRYDAGKAVRVAVETRVLPLADEQDAEVRRVAQLGRVDPLLLLQAIKSQSDAKVRLLDARAAESIGAIRLDELIGPPSPPPDAATAKPVTGSHTSGALP